MRNAIDLDGSELIVDIGCGNGADLSLLASAGHVGPLIGIDLSAGMLAAIQERTILRALGDAMALPFVTSSADVVLAMHMLYHVPDIPIAIAEARRVLRPGGAFVASTNSSNSMRELMEVWREALSTVSDQPIDLRRDSASRFSLENGRELLTGSFSSIELKRFRGVLRVPDARVVRNYVDSTRDLYEQTLPDPSVWPQAMDIIEARVGGIISSDGLFEISADRGIFVCR